MQSTRPLFNLVKYVFSSSSINKATGNKLSPFRKPFGMMNFNSHHPWSSSYRLFTTSAFRPGIPEKLDLQPGEHAVGLDGLEQHVLRKGQQLPYQAVLTGAFGTIEHPVLVPTVHKERFVGCCGSYGDDHEPEEHDTTWFLMVEGGPVACPVCAQVFKLTPDNYPEKFVNVLYDTHQDHGHHHAAGGDHAHELEITPITSKDVEDVLGNGYSLKKKLKVSEYIEDLLSHGHDSHGHKADAHHDSHGHKTDTHAGPKADTHAGPKADTHTGPKADPRKDSHGHKADTHAGHKH